MYLNMSLLQSAVNSHPENNKSVAIFFLILRTKQQQLEVYLI